MQEERHVSVEYLPCPESVKTVSERGGRYDRGHQRQQDIRLDREVIVVEVEFLVALLPGVKFSRVIAEDAEGLDHLEVIESLDLE